MLRQPKQITYILPYFIENKEEYEDPQKLLETDQRDIWWKRYGIVTGKNYASMPNLLKRKSLKEITAQPLLNYLVALSYDRKQIDFSDDTTLNQIYGDLIDEVYCRQYEGGRVNVRELKQTQFKRVLEEIALAVWHGNGRTATVRDIQAKCEAGGIQRYLELFKEGAKAGVTRLLTAFYFRQSAGYMDGDPTFEFTHKSFGEYLTALRLLRVLQQIQDERKRKNNDPDYGWTEMQSLERWAEFCFVTALDEDLLKFLNNELRMMTSEYLSELQLIISDLLTYTINYGIAFSSGITHKNFNQLLIQAQNAEEALLAIHFAIATTTKEISRLDLKSKFAFGDWISRLRGQRQGPQNRLLLKSLGFLNLPNCFCQRTPLHNSIIVSIF